MNNNENTNYVKFLLNEVRSYYNGEEVNDDGEQMDIYDYINKEVLDTEYILDAQLNLIGVKLYVTLNGPTAWIDTREQTVNLSWGSDKAWLYMDGDICEELNEIFSQEVAAKIA